MKKRYEYNWEKHRRANREMLRLIREYPPLCRQIEQDCEDLLPLLRHPQPQPPGRESAGHSETPRDR